MSVKVPEIYWHGNKERIMSLDFQPDTNTLITAGSDSEFQAGFMKEWRINLEKLFQNEEEIIEMNNDRMHAHIIFVGNLENGHTSTVNVVKFNKTGKQLASGSDDHKIIIWEKKEKPIFGTEEREVVWSAK